MLMLPHNGETGLSAWLFPGQGSQEVGMGSQLIKNSQRARDILAMAEEMANEPLQELMSRGPSDRLSRSEIVQPAIVALSCVYIDYLLDQGLSPNFVAGHSLGELTALYASKAVSLENVLRLAVVRGKLMSQGPPGGMIAIKNLDVATIESVVNQIKAGTVCLANLNAPTQIVVSGDEEGLEGVQDVIAQLNDFPDGSVRPQIVRLEVSGAWHSPLVAVANHEFSKFASSIVFSDPKIPIASSGEAKLLTKAEQIRNSLCRQMTRPVRWYETVELLKEQGVNRFLEVGSGKVLKGLMRRILSATEAYEFETVGSPRFLKKLESKKSTKS